MVLEDLCNGTLGGCNLTSQYGPQTHNETFRQTLGFLLAVSSGKDFGVPPLIHPPFSIFFSIGLIEG